MSKRSIFGAAILVLSTVATGNASAQDAVKIGMVMPMTGPLAAAGQQVLAAPPLYETARRHGCRQKG